MLIVLFIFIFALLHKYTNSNCISMFVHLEVSEQVSSKDVG